MNCPICQQEMKQEANSPFALFLLGKENYYECKCLIAEYFYISYNGTLWLLNHNKTGNNYTYTNLDYTECREFATAENLQAYWRMKAFW